MMAQLDVEVSTMLARLRITTRINLTLLLGVIGTLIVVSIGYSIMRVQMMDERQSQASKSR